MQNATAQSAIDRLTRALPSLADAPAALREALAREAVFVALPAGAELFRERQACTGFPVVLSGRARIARTLDNGRELVLYDVEPGEACVLSTSCLLGDASYNAHARCETALELALLPRALFDRLIVEHKPFREELFHLFGERLVRLVELAEAVGFQRLDQRLAAALLGHGTEVRSSHEQLASQLAASRESISRTLKAFEQRGCVRLGRGSVTILDPRALRAIAAGTAEAV
jgi:CRP/FNR family transcriptional regulator